MISFFQTYEEYEERYMKWPTISQYGYNDYHPNGYDAIWAAALALNMSIEPLSKWVSFSNISTISVQIFSQQVQIILMGW